MRRYLAELRGVDRGIMHDVDERSPCLLATCEPVIPPAIAATATLPIIAPSGLASSDAVEVHPTRFVGS
jgi:hypothetical protein